MSFTGFYYSEKENDLKSRAVLVANILESYPSITDADLSYLCKKLKEETNTRYTIINLDGIVIGDSHEDVSTMDLHSTRPEIMDAYSGIVGTSIRYSNTLNQEMLYLALLQEVHDTKVVIRTSIPTSSLQENLFQLTVQILSAAIFVMIAALGTSLVISKKIAIPLENMVISAEKFSKGEFTEKIKRTDTLEINSLADSLNAMAKQLDEKIKMITIQKNENDAILSSMSEGLIATNQLNKIIKINNQFKNLFDIVDGDQGTDIRSVIKNDDFLEFYKRLVNQNKSQKIEATIDSINKKTILCSGTMLKNQYGNFIGNVIIINDITKVKALERVRKEFIANVSHELKTPLTALKGYVETLKEVNNEKDKLFFLDILDRHTSRMNLIINDLLELSKLEESDKSRLDINKTNINSLLGDALTECEYAASKKNININVNCKNDIYFILDERLIKDAVVNLIHNAIQYSSKGNSVKLDCKINKNELFIGVEDFGIGIEPYEIEKIFNRFYCIDKSHSKISGGTGLGLSIVKHIINLHNGRIDVQSQKDIGSTFTLIIPKSIS